MSFITIKTEDGNLEFSTDRSNIVIYKGMNGATGYFLNVQQTNYQGLKIKQSTYESFKTTPPTEIVFNSDYEEV